MLFICYLLFFIGFQSRERETSVLFFNVDRIWTPPRNGAKSSSIHRACVLKTSYQLSVNQIRMLLEVEGLKNFQLFVSSEILAWISCYNSPKNWNGFFTLWCKYLIILVSYVENYACSSLFINIVRAGLKKLSWRRKSKLDRITLKWVSSMQRWIIYLNIRSSENQNTGWICGYIADLGLNQQVEGEGVWIQLM